MRRRLRPLLKNKRLGFPAFEAYCELWERVGFEEGKTAIEATGLAGSIGRDVRRVRDWIDAWQHFGLVELIDYEPSTGLYHLYVHEPEKAFEPHVRKAPPQSELFCGTAAERPAESPSNQTTAEPPRNRGDEIGQRTVFSEHGGTAAEPPAESPPIDYRTIEETILPIGSTALNETNSSSKTLSPTETTRAAEIDDAEAMKTLLEQTRKPHEPPPADDPAEVHDREKQRLRDRLLSWACKFYVPDGTRLDPARAGQFADHVLLDGLPEQKLWELTEQLEKDWESDSKITSPLGVFDHRLEKALAQLGIPTRAKSKRRPR